MNESIIPVEAIRERDIDLILLEELAVNARFRSWFIEQLSLPTLTSSDGVWRSMSDFGLGETDIVFSYYSDQSKIIILIENKLDATFQDEQFGRYQKRVTQYMSNGKCSEAFAVLIAPDAYCQNQDDFELYVSYEEICTQLESGGSERGTFRSQLLRIGIEKLRRGYQPVNSLQVQKFWKEYWVYKESHYPILQMKQPMIVPDNSDWPMLYHPDTPSVTFRHKLAQGNVDATFGYLDQETLNEIQNALPPEVNLVKHRKTFSIRIFTGKVDRRREFNDQVELVESGLRAITTLTAFILDNSDLLLLHRGN